MDQNWCRHRNMLGNNPSNFQLHRFTRRDNTAKTFRGLLFLTHTVDTKRSVLWPSKYAKIRFWPGLYPGSRWRSSRRSPIPRSRLRKTPFSYPTPLGIDPPSVLVMCPPEFQPDLRLWARVTRSFSCWCLAILLGACLPTRACWPTLHNGMCEGRQGPDRDGVPQPHVVSPYHLTCYS